MRKEGATNIGQKVRGWKKQKKRGMLEWKNVNKKVSTKECKIGHLLNLLSTAPWRSMGEWRYSYANLDLGSPGEGVPCTHWIGCWVGPRPGLDAVEKRKISCIAGNRSLAVQHRNTSLYRLGYSESKGGNEKENKRIRD
jgi:hypothetical protein